MLLVLDMMVDRWGPLATPHSSALRRQDDLDGDGRDGRHERSRAGLAHASLSGFVHTAAPVARGATSAEIRAVLHPDRAAHPPVCAHCLREIGTPQPAAGADDLERAERSTASGLQTASE